MKEWELFRANGVSVRRIVIYCEERREGGIYVICERPPQMGLGGVVRESEIFYL